MVEDAAGFSHGEFGRLTLPGYPPTAYLRLWPVHFSVHHSVPHFSVHSVSLPLNFITVIQIVTFKGICQFLNKKAISLSQTEFKHFSWILCENLGSH